MLCINPFPADVRPPSLQVQNQLNAFMVLAAVLWCVLGAVTMILQDHSTQQAVIALWYVPNTYTTHLLLSNSCPNSLCLRHE